MRPSLGGTAVDGGFRFARDSTSVTGAESAGAIATDTRNVTKPGLITNDVADHAGRRESSLEIIYDLAPRFDVSTTRT
ncbi:MAG TPA: hypothetical protein VHV78_13630 [Gemmatimonadaceae bacterium]|nr:hypothetical protein [Gemmatimonadaceae bacterium]